MNTMLTKEQEINSYMSLLGISKREAEKLWEDDHSEEVLPEVQEMEKKAKQIKRYEKSDKQRKPAAPKQRKINPIKQELFSTLTAALTAAKIEYTPKNESEIHFRYKDENFTIKLILHRTDKSQ